VDEHAVRRRPVDRDDVRRAVAADGRHAEEQLSRYSISFSVNVLMANLSENPEDVPVAVELRGGSPPDCVIAASPGTRVRPPRIRPRLDVTIEGV
jgi:hypothetical protein